MEPPVSETARFTRRTVVIETDLDSELVLLDPDSRQMFSLNPVARLIWAELDGNTVGEVVDLVVATFAVDRPRALNDVSMLVADLMACGLITPAADAR